MSGEKSIITRRQFIGRTAAASLALTTNRVHAMSKPVFQKNASSRAVRFVHMTDIHIEDKNSAPQGLSMALRHIHLLKDEPDLIITGGDHVMDALAKDKEDVDLQFSLLKQIFDKECKLPVKHCLGNHDIWGWDKEKSKTTGDEDMWGKKRALYELDMPGRYYAFDQDNWEIIILDSISQDDSVYTARLDEGQFDWLTAQLEANSNKHICIISHIPIVSAACIFREYNNNIQWVLKDERIHIDAVRIKNLFMKYPNVRLCISGHLHLLERVEYNNVAYISNGSICAKWWKGAFVDCQEGYGIFNLYSDGSFDYEYVDYGWEAYV